jgi:hypothetical protein
MRHLRGANEFERVSSSIYGLANFRSSVLLVPMIAVSMFPTFNISSAVASHSGSEVCDTDTGHYYEFISAPSLIWGCDKDCS